MQVSKNLTLKKKELRLKPNISGLISLLSLILKLIEKSIHNQMQDYQRNKLFFIYQSGSGAIDMILSGAEN